MTCRSMIDVYGRTFQCQRGEHPEGSNHSFEGQSGDGWYMIQWLPRPMEFRGFTEGQPVRVEDVR